MNVLVGTRHKQGTCLVPKWVHSTLKTVNLKVVGSSPPGFEQVTS